MKHYRTSLPPLDYLLFFEAAARHGNFTKAAEELNVSQAAVSKRVKYLEEWLGMELVSRTGRTVEPSFKGAKLATHISEALDYLSMSIAQVSHINQEKLSLAANVTVSQYWLTPRIKNGSISSLDVLWIQTAALTLFSLSLLSVKLHCFPCKKNH